MGHSYVKLASLTWIAPIIVYPYSMLKVYPVFNPLPFNILNLPSTKLGLVCISHFHIGYREYVIRNQIN